MSLHKIGTEMITEDSLSSSSIILEILEVGASRVLPGAGISQFKFGGIQPMTVVIALRIMQIVVVSVWGPSSCERFKVFADVWVRVPGNMKRTACASYRLAGDADFDFTLMGNFAHLPRNVCHFFGIVLFHGSLVTLRVFKMAISMSSA